jgi:hypothetical protein
MIEKKDFYICKFKIHDTDNIGNFVSEIEELAYTTSLGRSLIYLAGRIEFESPFLQKICIPSQSVKILLITSDLLLLEKLKYMYRSFDNRPIYIKDIKKVIVSEAPGVSEYYPSPATIGIGYERLFKIGFWDPWRNINELL